MFVRTTYGDPPYYMRGYADQAMEFTEHMWCRWCGAFGLADQMVCSDSECITKDMTQGALSGLMISTAKTAFDSQDAVIAQIKASVTVQYSTTIASMNDGSFTSITAS